MDSLYQIAEIVWNGTQPVRAFLFEWQTLVGALTALLAAWLTVKMIRGQISEDTKRYNDSLERKGNAWRARLPDAIADVSEYAQGCFSQLVANPDKTLDIMYPHESMESIKSSIEYLNPTEAKMLIELVVFAQIHRTRLAGHRVGGDITPASYRAYDCVLLYHLAVRTLNFARGGIAPGSTEIPINTMYQELHRMHVNTSMYNPELICDVQEKINSHHKKLD